MLMAIIGALFAVAITVLIAQAGMALGFLGGQHAKTKATLSRVSDALISFSSVNQRLPCPANPTLGPVSPGYGFPDGNTSLTTPISNCGSDAGVVPWAALGLKVEDVTDEWGRLISYRVYDDSLGLTQNKGASAVDCDTNNGSTPETPPVPATGLCDTNHNTLESSFINYGAMHKGSTLSNYGSTVSNVAFVLISHGQSGLGGYLPSGTRLPMPQTDAADYPNTQASPAAFFVGAVSQKDVPPGTTSHNDDVVEYVTVADLLAKSKLVARDWPEQIEFSPSTTTDMTSPSTDPLRPHFMTSGNPGSGQEFTANMANGETEIEGGAGLGAYGSCLWWPLRLDLKIPSRRNALIAYLEFSANYDTADRFPGFTLGFLSGAYPAPNNTTCGTTYAVSTAAVGVVGTNEITVVNSAGIEVGMEVSIPGVDPTARVAAVVGNTVTLDMTNSSAVNGTAQFADGGRIRRDLGWAGGTLATSFPYRFAVEFDAYSNTGFIGPPVVPTALDPSRPHLSVDFSGVKHDGTATEASDCAIVGSGLPCDSRVSPFFTGVTRTATGEAGQSSILITDASGITGVLHGMTVSGSNIGIGATVVSINDKLVTLSVPNTGSVSGAVTFDPVSTLFFMQSGLTVFNSMRTEVFPQDCTSKASSVGAAGTTTITLPDVDHIRTGMAVYGLGVAYGTRVTGISGANVVVSAANTAAVTGPLVFGGTSLPSTAGSGAAGANTISVVNSTGIAVGMAVSGTGIASGAVVTAISGTTISLSTPNDSAVSGTIDFTQPAQLLRTLVKSWTLSNAGCNANPSSCRALSNVTTLFTENVTSNEQFLHAVSCVPASTPDTAFDSLYFGITTANRSLTSTASKNVIFRRLAVTDTLTLP